MDDDNQPDSIVTIKGPTETYTITSPKTPVTRELFLDFLAEIRSIAGPDAVSEYDRGYAITIRDGQPFIVIHRGSGDMANIKIMTARSDYHAVYTFRAAAWYMKLDVKHDGTSLRLPKNPHLILPFLLVKSAEFLAIMESSVYNLAFIATSNRHQPHAYYLKHRQTNEIVIANPGLLDFYLKHGIYEANDEFAYKVADNPADFVLKLDAGLIPEIFYEYFGRSQKIINQSQFPLHNIKRKVFFTPYVYELDAPNDNLNRLSGGGMLADKVRPGETLDASIRRVLREELKVSGDYIGAIVEPSVSFDRDRENKLTPHLTLHVYLRQTDLNDNDRKSAQRGWSSLTKDKD